MNQQFRHRQFPAGNPLANALVVIVGGLAIGVAVVLGFVAFMALASILLVFGAIVGIRVWWMNRRLRRQQRGAGKGSTDSPNEVSVIEGEYRVVTGRKDTESKG